MSPLRWITTHPLFAFSFLYFSCWCVIISEFLLLWIDISQKQTLSGPEELRNCQSVCITAWHPLHCPRGSVKSHQRVESCFSLSLSFSHTLMLELYISPVLPLCRLVLPSDRWFGWYSLKEEPACPLVFLSNRLWLSFLALNLLVAAETEVSQRDQREQESPNNITY